MTSADFDLPGPVVLEPGDVARLIDREMSRAERATDAVIADMWPATPALVTCSSCNTEQARRETGGPAVHFATREAIRPCAGSWPAKVPR